MSSFWRVVTRKKILDPNHTEQTPLARVLNTFDLTALGVGSTLGVGVYVLAGHVARDTAGPSVILSFLIAAVASVFAGLCYAEFGARTPKAGSAYIYSYVSIGEIVAFIVGWNLILEYVIGSASVARGLSVYLDSLINNTMQDYFREITPINVQYMSAYFDFFSFGLSVILAVALAFGLKESSIVNNIMTSLNIGIVLFVVIAGSIRANPENWNVPSNTSSAEIGNGGFFPFGIEGMIKGAATCFYGFIGFDCIATTGEEVKNPQRAIPVSIITSLAIIFLAYFSTSTVLTLMVPYYLQDINAPIPFAFEEVGWAFAKWIVAIGGMFGLLASLFGAMFPLPRIIYAMASDGLIFKFLGRVNQRFRTPVIGTLLAGLLSGLMGALFELKQLVNMMSIGTLMAYTLVAACVIILRYTENQTFVRSSENLLSQEDSLAMYQKVTFSGFMRQIFNLHGFKFPTKTSELLVAIEVALFSFLCLLMGLCAIYLKNPISHGRIWAIVLTSIVGLLILLLLLSLSLQPASHKELRFKVPFVPLIPALSILINIYLMLMLDPTTWIRFAVWMAFGMPMYFISVFGSSKDPNQFSIKYSNNLTSVQSPNHNHSEKYNGYANKGFNEDELKVETPKTNGTSAAKTNSIHNKSNGERILNDFKDTEEAVLKDENVANGEITHSKKVKPRAPPPPLPSPTVPKIEEDLLEHEILVKKESGTASVDTASVNNALAILDEVILKEEENQEILSIKEDENSFERNSSFDSLSLISNTPREESVVAIVHQEDTKSVNESIKAQNDPKPVFEIETPIKDDESTEKQPENDIDPPSSISDIDNNQPVIDNEPLDLIDSQSTNLESSENVDDDKPLGLTDNKSTNLEPCENVDDDKPLGLTDNKSTSLEASENVDDDETLGLIDNKSTNLEASENVDDKDKEPIKEKEPDTGETFNIPPPPPLQLDLFDFQTIPRVPKSPFKNETSFATVEYPKTDQYENKINLEELASEIQRRSKKNSPNATVTIPPVDYDHVAVPNGTLKKSNAIVDYDDNVTFGSEQHKKITSKLEKVFGQFLDAPPPKKLTKPEIPQVNDISPPSPYSSLEYDDNIPTDQLPILRRSTPESNGEQDFKSKLSEILLRRSVRPTSASNDKDDGVKTGETQIENAQNGKVKNQDQNNETPAEDYDTEQITHRAKMNDAFKSIRLRKVDSFKNT